MTKDRLKHWGMFLIGIGCLAVSVFVPPLSPILGPIGTKITGVSIGGALLVATDFKKIRNKTV